MGTPELTVKEAARLFAEAGMDAIEIIYQDGYQCAIHSDTTEEELKELKQGRKAYPKELEEARYELRNRLHEKCGKFVNVQILADLLDVRDERWHNAIEGYLGNNKLLLVVEPKYAKTAMEIYQDMDKKKFFRAAVLDTEKVQETEWEVKEGALAQELIAKEPYVQALSLIHI